MMAVVSSGASRGANIANSGGFLPIVSIFGFIIYTFARIFVFQILHLWKKLI